MPEIKRINTIDRLRGLSVVLMVIANYLKHFDWVPSWMKHAHPYGLTFVDFIAPCFFFIIGITYSLSLKKRMKHSDVRTVYRYFRMRAFYIFLIGSVLMVIEMIFPGVKGFDVNILQAISLAILVSIPFVEKKVHLKIIIGIIIGIIEHFILIFMNGTNYMLKDTRAVGVIGWIGLLFLGLAIGDIFYSCREKNNFRSFWLFSFIYIMSGIILSIWIPLFHSAATLSYNLLTTGIVSVIFLSAYLLTEKRILSRGFLCIWGSNPLVAFIVHFLLIVVCRSLISIFEISNTFPVFFIISFFLYSVIIQSLLWYLFKKQVFVKI